MYEEFDADAAFVFTLSTNILKSSDTILQQVFKQYE